MKIFFRYPLPLLTQVNPMLDKPCYEMKKQLDKIIYDRLFYPLQIRGFYDTNNRAKYEIEEIIKLIRQHV